MDLTELDRKVTDTINAMDELRAFLAKQGGFAAVGIMLAQSSNILEELLLAARKNEQTPEKEVADVAAVLGLGVAEPEDNVTPMRKRRK